jgi:hypothetical protein
MDDKEIASLFTGYGYQCQFVEDLEDIVSREQEQLPFQGGLLLQGSGSSNKHAVGS